VKLCGKVTIARSTVAFWRSASTVDGQQAFWRDSTRALSRERKSASEIVCVSVSKEGFFEKGFERNARSETDVYLD
jgi:CHASE1-domain containing sensor protein